MGLIEPWSEAHKSAKICDANTWEKQYCVLPAHRATQDWGFDEGHEDSHHHRLLGFDINKLKSCGRDLEVEAETVQAIFQRPKSPELFFRKGC